MSQWGDISQIQLAESAILTKMSQHQILTNNVDRITDIQASRLEFGSVTKSILDAVNQRQVVANELVKRVDLGQSDDLIGATIAAQKASLSFSALMQVRNKMVSNFNDIVKMSI